MKSQYYTVVEIHENKLLQSIFCENRGVAEEHFSKIVSEYGVDSYEEMIADGIFENEDGYTVQIMQMNR